MSLSLQTPPVCLFVVCGCARAHGLFTKLEGRRQLAGVSSLLPLRNLGPEAEQQEELPTELPPRPDILLFSHTTPFWDRVSVCNPGLVWNVWRSSRLHLPSSGVTRVSHHHTCVTTYNLLLVKWTKSRVSQFAEIATNLHKRGNVLVFIVHTPSKSQVWGNIQVKQLSFINRWIVRRKKRDRKHSRIMTVDKEIGILLSSKWFGREKNFNLQN